jgi:SAM-dependent methyltransferase
VQRTRPPEPARATFLPRGRAGLGTFARRVPFARVSPSSPRYDEIADWYVEYTRDWGTEPIALLPEELANQRVLDLACGYGRASRYLAAHGATVTGLDASPKLLARAEEFEAGEGLGIRYVVGDATGTAWWDGQPFDGVLCNLALMDIDDLDAALATIATVLEPGGWFTFSLFHPCYPGGWDGSPTGLPSWSPEAGYSSEGWWTTNGVGVRGHVGATHRMLSTYLNAVLRAGFDFDDFMEPAMPLPVYFAARCRRGA